MKDISENLILLQTNETNHVSNFTSVEDRQK
jgi:hypothetical protein